MIIQSKLIRAALVCAAKNDVRYYLNGLHITPKHIEATNGHVALRMEHGIRTKKNIIVQFEGPVPAKAETTELVFNKEAFAIHRDAFNLRISITGIKLVDGLFPDMERVIPKKWISASIRLSRRNISVIRRRCLVASGNLFPCNCSRPANMARYVFSSIRLLTRLTAILNSL